MIGRSPSLVVRAQADQDRAPAWKRAIGERRRLLEQVRQTNLKHVNGDLDKIVKREVDFTKRVIEELVPVKITWRKDASNGWLSSFMDALPFKVEVKESPFKAHTVKMNEAVVATSVTEEEAIEPEVSLDGPIA
jgi:hypothetical protein